MRTGVGATGPRWCWRRCRPRSRRALAGLAYRVPYLHGVAGATGMGLHTAVAFLLLKIALLACRPDRQLVRTFIGPGLSGLLARRLVPAVVLAPMGVGMVVALGSAGA